MPNSYAHICPLTVGSPVDAVAHLFAGGIKMDATMRATAASAQPLTRRCRRRPWMVLAVVILALTVGLSLIEKVADAADLNSIRAESTLWIYGHSSGRGYRVADRHWSGQVLRAD